MGRYYLAATDWDMVGHEDEVRSFKEVGCETPSMALSVSMYCGELFPYIISKREAISFAKRIKKAFPFVKFSLMEEGEDGGWEPLSDF